MKRIFSRAVLPLVLAAVVCVFPACNDDDDNNGDKRFSELQGSYELTTVEKDNGGGTINNLSLTITPTWVDADKLPTVDISAIMGYSAGTMVVGLADMMNMMEPLLANIVMKGLVELDLNDDGTLGARYHEFQSQGSIAADFMAPKFAEAVSVFPGESDPLPADALQYYTKGGKIYFGVSKDFISGLDESLGSIIDEMLSEYKTLPVVSTDKLYALPLQYTNKDGVLKVYLDRATLAPFAPLIPVLLQLVGDGVDLGGIDINDIVTKLIASTSELEIAIYLKPTI